eukprot:5655311-Pleurochrysis_carterae.AAC.7
MEEAFQEFSAVTTDGNSSGESNEQLTSMVDRKSFVRNVLLVLRLALEGAPAMLLSARALRNIALQRTQVHWALPKSAENFALRPNSVSPGRINP